MARTKVAPFSQKVRLAPQEREQQTRQRAAAMVRPSCPAWLDPEAKKVWRYLMPLLEEMKVITKVDRPALTRYCQLWARWIKNEQFLQKFGETYPLKDGNGQLRCFVPFPQVATASKLSQQLLRLEQEFGLTPSARSSLDIRQCGIRGVERSVAGDRFDAFVARGGIRPRLS